MNVAFDNECVFEIKPQTKNQKKFEINKFEIKFNSIIKTVIKSTIQKV